MFENFVWKFGGHFESSMTTAKPNLMSLTNLEKKTEGCSRVPDRRGRQPTRGAVRPARPLAPPERLPLRLRRAAQLVGRRPAPRRPPAPPAPLPRPGAPSLDVVVVVVVVVFTVLPISLFLP